MSGASKRTPHNPPWKWLVATYQILVNFLRIHVRIVCFRSSLQLGLKCNTSDDHPWIMMMDNPRCCSTFHLHILDFARFSFSCAQSHLWMQDLPKSLCENFLRSFSTIHPDISRTFESSMVDTYSQTIRLDVKHVFVIDHFPRSVLKAIMRFWVICLNVIISDFSEVKICVRGVLKTALATSFGSNMPKCHQAKSTCNKWVRPICLIAASILQKSAW